MRSGRGIKIACSDEEMLRTGAATPFEGVCP
jgi:hypothetical protein